LLAADVPPIVSRVANQSSDLTEVFYALADPTRRAIVGTLGRGPETVSALAAPFEMALPSFLKHLSVLERCGVVRSAKLGRVRTCELVQQPLTQVERWLAGQRVIWEARSDRMARFAERLHQEESHVPSPAPSPGTRRKRRPA
jgi:DNA-binding transcriptional ArsR family regulator